MGDMIFIIVIVIFLVGKALASKAARNARERQTPGENGAEANQAPQDKIRQFLEQVQGGRQQPARSAPQARPVARTQTPQEQFPIPEPVEAIPVAQPVRPAKKTVKRKTSKSPRTRVAPPPAAAPPPSQSAAPTTVRVAGANLKKAIVWSEILRPPVSMRKRVGHRPPQLEKK